MVYTKSIMHEKSFLDKKDTYSLPKTKRKPHRGNKTSIILFIIIRIIRFVKFLKIINQCNLKCHCVIRLNDARTIDL